MNKNLNNLTILVNSCDSYEDLWEPFFKLFKKFGGELTSCPIVLNTERKQYSYDGLNIICPNNYDTKIAWGQRLKDTLKYVSTDYILFLLDDFFLQRNANIKTISNCIAWLEENENVGAFNFLSLKEGNEPDLKFPGFCLIDTNAEYRLNSQACLWKKNVLINALIGPESPWDWEILGNKRNAVILKDFDFYCISELEEEPYFYNSQFCNKKYSEDLVRNAIIRGKWDLSCIDKCFKENDIYIDYTIRGLYTPETSNSKKQSILYRCLRKIYHILFASKIKKQKQLLEEKELEKQRLLVDEPIKEYLKTHK